MEKDLPDRFNDLVIKESIKGTTLRKRSKDEESKPSENKPSIKDRIKVREDVKDKRIKVASTPIDKVEEKTALKEEETEKTKKDPAKVRCNFWPSCKKTDCPFVHPKEKVS